MAEDRKLIWLEGNIAAGKSTVGRSLKESGEFAFIEEPVEAWRSGFASNILDDYYRDSKRWAFALQIVAFTTRAKTWKEILAQTDHSRVVLERSVFADRHVFATLLYNTGRMTETEWQAYCGLWDFLVANYVVEPDCVLYLRTPAKVCLERIKERGRKEETEVTLEYLLQLERLHDDWMVGHPKLIVIDGSMRWSADEVLKVTREFLQ